MNMSDSIESLLDGSVVEITILKNPKEKTFVVQAKQFVTTGPMGNRANMVHQVEDQSFVNAIEKLKRDVEHINELGTKLVHLKTQ